MKPRFHNQTPPPSSLPGPTTRARAVAIKDAQGPKLRTRKNVVEIQPQSPIKGTSPVKSLSGSAYDAITKVGPPRGHKKNQQQSRPVNRKDRATTSSSVQPPLVGGSVSDHTG
jgi:hypothetical protein